MGNKNYTKYSENSNNKVDIQEIPTTPETTPEVQNDSKEDKNNSGAIAPAVVANCFKLNVRKEASKDSDVIRVVAKGDELIVDLDASTEDFYKVEVAGMEGYCVKDFIEIK